MAFFFFAFAAYASLIIERELMKEVCNMLTIIDFAIKVYVYGKILDKIEEVGKDVGKKLSKKFSDKNKKGNEEFIETYFVD